MYNIFDTYLDVLKDSIPDYVYEIVLIVACFSFVLFVTLKQDREGFKWFCLLILIEYVFLLLSSTVFFRSYTPAQPYNLVPFWSYRVILYGDSSIELPEKIMNLVVFIPVGLLLGSAFQRIKWWQVLATGFLISLSIEMLQFTLKRGFAEFDDVFHNTMGCLIGYMLIKGSRLMAKG